MGSGVRSAAGAGEEEEQARRMAEESVLYVKVMTDEQLEVLRRQISVYAAICEQLVEMHKSMTAQQESLSGTRASRFRSFSSSFPGSWCSFCWCVEQFGMELWIKMLSFLRFLGVGLSVELEGKEDGLWIFYFRGIHFCLLLSAVYVELVEVCEFG